MVYECGPPGGYLIVYSRVLNIGRGLLDHLGAWFGMRFLFRQLYYLFAVNVIGSKLFDVMTILVIQVFHPCIRIPILVMSCVQAPLIKSSILAYGSQSW